MDKKCFGYAIHWIPRIVGTLLFVMLIIFAVGEGVPNPMKQPLVVQIEMLAMFIIWLGLLIAWKSELIGGMSILLGYTCFCGVEWQALNIKFPFGLFLFVGLFYMLSWWSKKRQKSST
ncbi:MAG: hypothetical protein ABII25_00995 [bacterium]